MRWIALLATTLWAAPVAAQNLLINPDFDQDPTVSGNGWSATGTGSLEWNQALGDPSPPSARTHQTGTQSMTLWQCVPIVAGSSYDFSARSYTYTSTAPAMNRVALAVFASDDCSGAPIETVIANQQTFPNFALRERIGYVAPLNARSARIELLSDANSTVNDITWDNVILHGPATPVAYGTWGAIKAVYR